MSEQISDMVRRYPFVSVVVPTLNSPDRTKTCIEALLSQTYPKDRHEIIVVDNGSTDRTLDVIQQYSVRFLSENSVRSPYSARNKGIEHARGEIIAMTDVNCAPVPQWIEEGVEALEKEQADMVGGKVTFTFSQRKSVAEWFDSVSNVKMKSSIEERGVAKGGNLFVRKKVFKAIGLFPGRLRSGGDVLWTGKATRAGFRLAYCPEAEVLYPARKLVPLMKKSYRVGKGQPVIWMEQGCRLSKVRLMTFYGFRPPKFSFIDRIVKQRGTKEMAEKLRAIWTVAWLCTTTANLGRIVFFIENWLSQRQDISA